MNAEVVNGEKYEIATFLCVELFFFFFPMADTYTCYDGEVSNVDRSYGYDCKDTRIETSTIYICVKGKFVALCKSEFGLQDAQTYCQDYYGSGACEYSCI